MLLQLDFSIATPIYQQIRDQIVRGIAEGEFAPDERLPTVRALAGGTRARRPKGWHLRA